MSKHQIKKIEIPVETVDNWYKSLDYIYATMRFWKLENKWPTNLIYDVINVILNDMIDIKCKI